MTRAGRPVWALLATGILFLLTTALAALISHQKSRQTAIILGESQPFLTLGARASFPAGWQVSTAEGTGNGSVLVASPADASVGRHLLLFRVRPSLMGPGHLARAAAIIKAVRAVDPEAQLGGMEAEPSPSTLGSLESEVYRLVMMSPAMGSDVQAAVANVAVTPDRQILGVVLVAQGQLTARDRRLLDKVSQSVSYQPGRDAAPRQEELDEPVDELQDEDHDTVRKPLVEVNSRRFALTDLHAV